MCGWKEINGVMRGDWGGHHSHSLLCPGYTVAMTVGCLVKKVFEEKKL